MQNDETQKFGKDL